ncbi:hypothetical protein Scep_017643 [Stephania cephalantha]|uniref:Glycoside hydrolase family 31 TIM barrel domain-containing protein n=1 Tax=Stephania cephalantha TaxID=152367 RepID=A0AAP0IQU5_9MAGN
MPPKWSLGYHQCRYSYESEERVLEDGFPNPKALVNELHLNGFKAIWMLDPGIKHEEGYFVYDSGSKRDVWIQNVDGKPFVGLAIDVGEGNGTPSERYVTEME